MRLMERMISSGGFRNASFPDLPPTCRGICILLWCSIPINKSGKEALQVRVSLCSGADIVPLALGQLTQTGCKTVKRWCYVNSGIVFHFWFINYWSYSIRQQPSFHVRHSFDWQMNQPGANKQNYSLLSEIIFAKPRNWVNILKENHLS